MFLYLCIISLGASVTAVTHEPCCTADQYEVSTFEIGAIVRSSSGKLIPRQEWLDLSYDYKNRREAHVFSFYHQDGSEFRGRSILDFKTNAHYVITHNDMNCTFHHLTRDMDTPCLPKNSTFMRRRYLGDGNDKLTVDQWEYDILGTDHIVTRDVSPNGCVPVITTRSGTVNASIETVSYTFYNFKQGIDDYRIFDVPLDCPTQRVNPLGRSLEILEKLERYRKHIH